MARKKKSTKKKTIFNNKKIIFIVLSVVLFFIVGGAFIGGYYFAKSTIKPNKVVNKTDIKTKEALKELQKLVDENIHKQTKKTEVKTHHKVKKTQKLVNSEAIDYQENKSQEKKVTAIKKPIIYTAKPKLVIIMDDMSFASQVKSLKDLGINVTPSFFPPSKRHPNTAIYAKEFKHYMVHFPMQATNPNFHEEPNTLHLNSSYDFIKNRVLTIKKEFPKAKFVNNHTGSKFTSDYYAMNKLYRVLNKYNMVFVDSRTTSKTQAPKLAKKYHQTLLSRDIFLDNKPDISYIQNQLKKAIKIAQRRGYAIAICHPHKTTFMALRKSKYLLKNIEVIYIDELYRLYQQHKLSKL
jgi:polysaccharide deacetylase 2 family uncharacterized protein YibQ/nitrate reductase NapE component